MTKIIIPTYNEAKNIEVLLRELRVAVPDAEVLVVDDSSPDGTGHLVQGISEQDPSVRLLTRSKKEGLGKAYKAAFKYVLEEKRHAVLVMMDADFSHGIEYVPLLLDALRDADVAVGSRYVQGGKTTGWEKWRIFLSTAANWYARIITRHPVHDLTAGFYAIRTDILSLVDPKELDASGYAFQIELKYRLLCVGARFIEVPIHFKNRREGESKISRHIISEGIIAPWKLIWNR